MPFFRLAVPVVLACSLSSSLNFAQSSAPRAQFGDTKPFIDQTYGYSVRIPTTWKPYSRNSNAEPLQRLCLATPAKNILIISVYKISRTVTSHSEFEQIGEAHVESVIGTYMTSFHLEMVVGRKQEDHSNTQGMIFWQGTSATVASLAPAMLISQHAIRYGSHFMINIVYVSGNTSKSEVRELDAVMRSLSFTK